jgi:hypothetical protein
VRIAAAQERYADQADVGVDIGAGDAARGIQQRMAHRHAEPADDGAIESMLRRHSKTATQAVLP